MLFLSLEGNNVKLHQNASSKRAALTGTMICIDPTSGGTSKAGEKSVAGYAIFRKGQLLKSGTIEYPEEKVVFKRLKNVFNEIRSQFKGTYELLVLEDIRGYRAQQSLIQSCGVYIVGLKYNEFLQLNISTWKAVAKHWGGYFKDDEQDAIYMGYAAIAIALGYVSAKPKALTAKVHQENKDRIINEAKEIVYGSSDSESTTSDTPKSSNNKES